jgi:outer membrane protein OmpA-like peptidoglycan-associated protein
MKKILLLLAFSATLALTAADLAGSKDNPFVSRFEGSSIVRYKAANYDTLSFRGMDKEKKGLAEPVSFEGKMVRIGYKLSSGQASSLEVYRNYENALKENGFEIQSSLQVDSRTAGDFTCQRNFPGITPYNSQNDYYIYATKNDPAGKVHVAVFVAEMSGDENDFKKGETVAFVDSLQLKPVGKKMVDGSAGDMAKQIAATGTMRLYGVYFDNDRAELKPQSKPTLDEVGKLMADNPDWKLKVVGHTDNLGTAEHNLDLSNRRATAVTQALVQDYNVAAARLTPLGAGATQPVAPNDTEENRAKNRRVELVKI